MSERTPRSETPTTGESSASASLWAALAGATVARRREAYVRVCALLRQADDDVAGRVAYLAALAGKEGARWERERLAVEAALERGRGIVRLLMLLRRHLGPSREASTKRGKR